MEKQNLMPNLDIFGEISETKEINADLTIQAESTIKISENISIKPEVTIDPETDKIESEIQLSFKF